MSTGKQIATYTETLGPAMTALNPRQRAFVVAMFDLGADATYTEAARRAGYPDNGVGNAIRVQAHHLAHNEKIQAAIREEAERMAGGLLPLAHKMMVDVMKNPAHRDHFKAVKHAQALAGISPTQKHEVVHKNDTASLRAQLAAAIDLFKSVAGPMIDVTPEVWLCPKCGTSECDKDFCKHEKVHIEYQPDITTRADWNQKVCPATGEFCNPGNGCPGTCAAEDWVAT